jgi:hypothetical protein
VGTSNFIVSKKAVKSHLKMFDLLQLNVHERLFASYDDEKTACCRLMQHGLFF